VACCTLPLNDCDATPAPSAALTGVAATGWESAEAVALLDVAAVT
jgi:hypothetical protein